jgi:Sperm-tail PG-rich repeat
MLEKTR